MSALIELKNVRKEYHMGDFTVKALDGIDVSIEAGEFVTIVGASGSGKSTLLHILGCLDLISDGQYRIGEHRLDAASDADLSRIRNARLGFVFQQFNLLSGLTVLENIALPLAYAGKTVEERQSQAKHYADRVGLGDRLYHTPTELSGGQAQRVAIARALVNNPDIIMADEPTGALDSKTGQEIMGLLHELHREGKTIIMVTHDAELAEEGTRKITIKDGKVLSDDIKAEPHTANQARGEGLFTGLNLRDLLRIGIKEGLLAHKLRTALTMLGVIIGVAAVIAMSSFSQGSKKKQADQIRALGANLVRIVDKQFENERLVKARTQGSPGLSVEQAHTIAKTVPGIAHMAMVRDIKLNQVTGKGAVAQRIRGVNSDYLHVNNLSIATGRFLDAFDRETRARVAVIGAGVAQKLEDSAASTDSTDNDAGVIGKTLILGAQPYRVVGILTKKHIDTDQLEASSENDPNHDILLPLQTVLHRTTFIEMRNELDEIQLQLNQEDDLVPAGVAIRRILDVAHRGVDDYDIVIPLNLLKTKHESQKLLDILTLCICAISLVVGGIGIMNIMLASVTERLREIGIRRAVGATKGDIQRQFLSEATFISIAGASVGIVTACVVVVGGAQLMSMPVVFSPVVILVAVGAATFTGLGFGYYPAAKAARQNLVEVLRND